MHLSDITVTQQEMLIEYKHNRNYLKNNFKELKLLCKKEKKILAGGYNTQMQLLKCSCKVGKEMEKPALLGLIQLHLKCFARQFSMIFINSTKTRSQLKIRPSIQDHMYTIRRNEQKLTTHIQNTKLR